MKLLQSCQLTNELASGMVVNTWIYTHLICNSYVLIAIVTCFSKHQNGDGDDDDDDVGKREG